MSADPIYLSRARLRRDVPAASLRQLLVPHGEAARIVAGHRIVWTLFGDSPERVRDFLWREADDGLFYLLSQRVPVDRHGLFQLDPPKQFAPAIAPGDRLDFMLRANATVARGGGPQRRGKPADIVMAALHGLAPRMRAEERRRILGEVAQCWLARQGETRGFSLPVANGADGETGGLRVASYRTLRLERGRGEAPMQAGVLDMEGTLVVRDPERLVSAIAHGFGRAKAYGCGLMLVRRPQM